MLLVASGLFIASIGLLAMLVCLTRREARVGNRLVLARVRSRTDTIVATIEQSVYRVLTGLRDRVITYNLYWVLNSFLRFGEYTFSWLSASAESARRRNRDLARRVLRRESGPEAETHLTQMATYKQETALTPAQKRKLRQRKLEERF